MCDVELLKLFSNKYTREKSFYFLVSKIKRCRKQYMDISDLISDLLKLQFKGKFCCTNFE